MRSRHITKILDRTKFDKISVEEAAQIGEHIKICRSCRADWEAARIASILLRKGNFAESFAPTPFFQAKVLGAWREKHNFQKPSAAFWKWWQASATLVLLMFAAVVGLMAASLLADRLPNPADGNTGSRASLYSTETVILNQNPKGTLTTGQVLEVLENDR